MQAAFWRTQVHRWNSSVWVRKNLNLFQQEHYLKLLPPPLPHLPSEQKGAWIRPKSPGRGRGQLSQHYRQLQVLCIGRGPACHSFGSPVLVASFLMALPEGPLISWNGSTVLSEPLSHPSERRLRFRIGWLFLKISEDEQTWCLHSDVERQGKLASTPASPERTPPHLSASAYLTGLMLTRLNIEKDATWPSTDIKFNKFCISESETSTEK